jgi:hypothetical protein
MDTLFYLKCSISGHNYQQRKTQSHSTACFLIYFTHGTSIVIDCDDQDEIS